MFSDSVMLRHNAISMALTLTKDVGCAPDVRELVIDAKVIEEYLRGSESESESETAALDADLEAQLRASILKASVGDI